MSELPQELFEKQLSSIASRLDYPPTPDLAVAVMSRLSTAARPRLISRRFAWTLTVIVILIASLMLIPPARAAILDFIQIGIVRIFRTEPTPVTAPQPQNRSTMVPVTATPSVTPQALIPILEEIAGETTLEEAQRRVDYSISLPTYPPDLGLPDRVYVQDADGDMTILVWIDPQQPEKVRMSLHLVPTGSWAIDKMNPAVVQETQVNGQPAAWAVGPYPLRLSNRDLQFERLIQGHVLIWRDGSLTYRLETDLSLEEAIKVAESLQPIRP